jgi:hypothetical protein
MMKNDNDLISEGNVMVIIKQMNYWNCDALTI